MAVGGVNFEIMGAVGGVNLETMGQWAESTWRRWGSGRSQLGDDGAVGGVNLETMGQWAESTWRRWGSGRSQLGDDGAVGGVNSENSDSQAITKTDVPTPNANFKGCGIVVREASIST